MATSNTVTRALHALMGRYSPPDQEFSVPFTPLATLKSPSSIRTDKVIAFLIVEFKGRLLTGATAFTPVPDALRYLIQEMRLYGTHAQFGAQTIMRVRAKAQTDWNTIMRVNYVPRDTVLKAGVPGKFDGAASTAYDVDIFVTIPLFPMPIPLHLAPLYSVKGPDWAGNLFFELDTADGTALGTTASNITFSAYGVSTGSPSVYVSVVRPNLTVSLMNAVAPAVPFRTYRLLDQILQGSAFTLQKISDLNIGKRTSNVLIQCGILQGGVSPGVRSYASFSDGIVTRSAISLDGKQLVMPYSSAAHKEFMSFLGGASTPVGYELHSFIRHTSNPDSSFPSETLTSARRFELDGDVTGAANQGGEIIQEEILGTPSISIASS